MVYFTPLKNRINFPQRFAQWPNVRPRLGSKKDATMPDNPNTVVQTAVLKRTHKYLN